MTQRRKEVVESFVGYCEAEIFCQEREAIYGNFDIDYERNVTLDQAICVSEEFLRGERDFESLIDRIEELGLLSVLVSCI